MHQTLASRVQGAWVLPGVVREKCTRVGSPAITPKIPDAVRSTKITSLSCAFYSVDGPQQAGALLLLPPHLWVAFDEGRPRYR